MTKAGPLWQEYKTENLAVLWLQGRKTGAGVPVDVEVN